MSAITIGRSSNWRFRRQIIILNIDVEKERENIRVCWKVFYENISSQLTVHPV